MINEQTSGKSAFNVQAALGRLMNNKTLYQKLLSRFEAEYDDYDSKVEKAVSDGNFEDVAHLAHTMKGLSGNLGADDLTEASRCLELAGKAGQEGQVTPELDAAMKDFSTELHRAVSEARSGVDMG